nr:MAG TPA: hypothetical protein [Caudoviricetes sp.]
MLNFGIIIIQLLIKWLKRAYMNFLSKGREEVEIYFLINFYEVKLC